MKKVLSMLVLICLLCSMFVLGCCSSPKYLTAGEVSDKLKEANLPISNAIVYTAETDPNKFLGRPNQYISKVNFADTRLDQLDATDPRGGSIEVFNNQSDLNTRKAYIEGITKVFTAAQEYIVVNGNYLLRLNKELTPAQVEEYKTAFMKLK